MQLGMSTAAFFGRYETEEAAEKIATLPLECAEVFLQSFSEYSVDFARTVRTALNGMACTSVHPLGTSYENMLGSASARQHRDAWDWFRRVLDAGEVLGAKTYVYHGRHTAQNRQLPWDLQRNVDILGPMCEEAEKRGMVIGWENVCWCQLTRPERVMEAKRALPQVRFTLDIKQAMRAGADPMVMAKAMGDQLCNVHLCDWQENGTLCLPGEGTYDFKGLVETFRQIGYDGPMVLEPYLALIRNDEALIRSVKHMQMILTRSGNR